MEKVFQKASARIWEEPPGPAGRGMLRWRSQGAPTKPPWLLALLKPAPLKGQQGESKHPRVLPSLLPAACPPRHQCCQALPGWGGLSALAAKTGEAPHAEGCRPLSPCLTAY